MGSGTASAAVGASAPPVAVARVVRLTVVAGLTGVVFRKPAAVQPCQDGSEEEEDTVHDAEGEAGLEKGACLVGVHTDPVSVEGAKDAEVKIVGRTSGDIRAVCAGDEAEVIHCCDECSDESCDLIGHVNRPWLR